MRSKNLAYYLHKNEQSLDFDQKQTFRDLVEIFHENSKMTTVWKPFLAKSISHHLTNVTQIYLDSKNKKKYVFESEEKLPTPSTYTHSFDDVIQKRSSNMVFKKEPLSKQTISNLLSSLRVTRSGQSKFNEKAIIKRRTYASAGALFPVEIYALIPNNNFTEWDSYNYDPRNHSITLVDSNIKHKKVAHAFQLDATKIQCGAVIVLSGIFNRSVNKYGPLGYRFSLIEAGGIIQQLGLACADMDLNGLTWGGALDNDMNQLIKIDGLEENYLISFLVGHQK